MIEQILDEQTKRIEASNKEWTEYLKTLMNAYWKNPRMKGEILDAIESIKYAS